MRKVIIAILGVAVAANAIGGEPGAAALSIVFPSGRTAFATNESIHICVARQADAAVAGVLSLVLSDQKSGKATCEFPVKAAPAGSVEHFFFNGFLLRPGRYTLQAKIGEQIASAELEICTHLRKSTFRTFHWGSGARGPEQMAMGEDRLGFNLIYGAGEGDHSLLGGVDWMRSCALGGGHQLALRLECDWSDPYSILGGVGASSARVALQHRTQPNAIGVHAYDEPGLTWWKDPETGAMTPHMIPAQVRSFISAFGHEPLRYNRVDPNNPEHLTAWFHWGRWKLAFMEATWRLQRFNVEWVNPDFISCTQSVYGWNAFADGYYFNIHRSLPVISGHGGYDDIPGGYFSPSYYYEMGRARDLSKPNWYLPAWYDEIPANRFRMEQYLCFQVNADGLATPPPVAIHRPSLARAADGVVESNKIMLRLGTIFPAIKPVDRSPVAMLYSLSHALYAQARDMNNNYTREQHEQLRHLYVAGRMLGIPFFPVVEEDVVDGTLAANHRALVLPDLAYLDPRAAETIKGFMAKGGLVIMTAGCAVDLPGAVKLSLSAASKYAKEIAECRERRAEWIEMRKFYSAGAHFATAAPLAAEIGSHLAKAGIEPAMASDNPAVFTSRQAMGDIEYLFAVNAAWDEVMADYNSIRASRAALTVADDGRPLYDALSGGEAKFAKKDGKLTAEMRFGAGQMRAFARTARPISGVKALTPIVHRDFARAQAPFAVEVGATLLDAAGRMLAGPAPLEIIIVDPLGYNRYHLYRATQHGVWRETLPLAANDPAGEWTLSVKELLTNSEDRIKFTVAALHQCGALAGAAQRALIFGRDEENIYRFFRIYRRLLIVKGAGDYDAIAERLAASLKPWDIACAIVPAAEVNKPRPISEEEAATWAGPNETSRNQVKAGDANSPLVVGYNIDAPAILIGTPEDNPLIKSLIPGTHRGVLPYMPKKGAFPGPGRGMIAWERGLISINRETVSLIAYDAEGMAEAAGTLYEICAGLKPLTPHEPPLRSEIAAAAEKALPAPIPVEAWSASLPDRISGLCAVSNGVIALSGDGTLARFDAAGKELWRKTCDGGEFWALAASNDGSLLAIHNTWQAIIFNGEGREISRWDAMKNEFGRGVASVAVAPDSSAVLAAGVNGCCVLFDQAGKEVWRVDTLKQEMFDKFAEAMKIWQDGAEARKAAAAAHQEAMAKYKADLDAWNKARPQREAALAEYRKAHAEWKKAKAEWDKKKEGPEPVEPAKPELPPQPQHPQKPAEMQAAPPERPSPRPYLAAIFAADSKTAVAIRHQQAEVIQAGDGQVKATLGGFPSGHTLYFTPCRLARWGQNIVIANGQRNVMLLSPSAGKVAENLQLPGERPAALAAFGEALLVGTESDFTVRCLRTLEGKVEDALLWQYTVAGRIPKQIAADSDRAAVAYWGGSVHILDAKGNLVASRIFEQDICGLAWIGSRLAVALADGRIIALATGE